MDIMNLYISMVGTVKVKSFKDGYKVFHNNTRAVGIINEDGKKLLEYCNGKSKIEEIIDKIENEYIGDKDQIRGKVVLGLKHFKWINLVKTKMNEIEDSYKYQVYSLTNSSSIDHEVFYLSGFKNNYLELIDEILRLSNEGVFQFSLICDNTDDKNLIFNVLDSLKNKDLIINLIIYKNIFNDIDIEKLKLMSIGKILIELSELDIKNINSDVKNSDFLKLVRKSRELEIAFEVQSRTNDVEEFCKFVRLCSLAEVSKIYYNYTDVNLKDKFKTALDNVERKLFSEYHSIPECIEANWFDSREVENIEYSVKSKKEA